jgi:hypothetical protein
MKRVALFGLVLAGCATRHPALVSVPVGAACIVGLGAASVAG